jgi:hypothetical protein
MTLAKRPLRQRVIALVAAYAIAVAGLIASFVAAQTAAEASARPDAVICHSTVAGQQAPTSNRADGKICADCCVGCITSLATLIPPTVATAGPLQRSFKRLDLPARSVRLAGAKFNAHRSRGPPQAL